MASLLSHDKIIATTTQLKLLYAVEAYLLHFTSNSEWFEMRKIYSSFNGCNTTLHRERRIIGKRTIPNVNPFKQRTVADGTAVGMQVGLRMAEALVLHNELFQLRQTLHCHRKNVRKGIGRNANGLKIGVVCERQFSHINLPAMGWANESLDGCCNHLGVEGLQTTQMEPGVPFVKMLTPPWSIYSWWSWYKSTLNSNTPGIAKQMCWPIVTVKSGNVYS